MQEKLTRAINEGQNVILLLIISKDNLQSTAVLGKKFEVHKTNITQTNSDSVIAKIFPNPYNCIFDDLYDEINFKILLLVELSFK